MKKPRPIHSVLLRLGAACLLAGTSFQALSQERIGLVLSGGGARGSAHIGVLKVLEELRIPIHAIVGTSMGSLVGGAYAAGVSVDEMERRVTAMDWNELFDDDPARPQWPARRKREAETPTWDFSVGERDGDIKLPKGAIAGQKVQLFLADLLQPAEGVENYDKLSIPFRAIATDLENGGMKVFADGPLHEALRASMSVPGLFAPLERAEGIYVDGGLVRNLPVDVMRKLGVDRIIAVNLGTSYLKREELGTILGVTGQMIAILTEQNVQQSLRELDPKKDVLIVPSLGDITAADFDRADEAIAIGESAARAVADELAAFSLPTDAYAAWQRAHFDSTRRPPHSIDEVRITGTEFVNPQLFDGLRANHAGRVLDRAALEKDIHALYARGDFERISYRVEQEAGHRVLIVQAVDKSWGPGYMSVGLDLQSDFSGDNRTSIRGVYRRTWLNRLGAEWKNEITLGAESRLFSEWYQPYDLERSWFVAPYVDLSSWPLSVFQNGDRIARYDVSHYRLGADLGATLRNGAEWRVGVRWSGTSFSVDTGDGALPEGSNNDTGVRARYVYDSLDSPFLPRNGERLQVSYSRPLELFGAEREYHRFLASWDKAAPFGADTMVVSLRLGSSFGDTVPYYDQFALGGLFKLAGYANEQFRGEDMAFGSLIYYRRLAELQPPLGRGLYVGGSLEAGYLSGIANGPHGQLADEKGRYGASIFFGADTWLGPFYLGWGLSAERNSTLYVQLGQP